MSMTKARSSHQISGWVVNMSFEVAGRKLESLVLKTLVRTVKVGKMKKFKLASQSLIN